MLRPALLALAALLISCVVTLAPALAGERIALTQAEEWDLSLYASEDEDGGLPGGGLALNLDFERLPAATLALDYSDSDDGSGEAEGPGLVATVYLIGEGADDDRFLRLNYRAGQSSFTFGTGGDGPQQTVTFRAGIRW